MSNMISRTVLKRSLSMLGLAVTLGCGAVNTAMLVQVFGSQFDDGSGRHGGCLSRRWKQPVHASCINENLGPASGASRSSCRF